MYSRKWIASILILSILSVMICAALAEEKEMLVIDEEVVPAEFIDGDTGLAVEGCEEEECTEDAIPTEGEDSAGGFIIPLPVQDLHYARVEKQGMEVLFEAGGNELVANLCKGDIVLVTLLYEGEVPIAFCAGSTVYEGYAKIGELSLLNENETAEYLNRASTEPVVLYRDSLDFPLVSISEAAYLAETSVMASKYKEFSNDTIFKINGKDIYANLVGSKGSGNCWAWARNLYHEIWGKKFDEKFEGAASTGYNLLYRLNDAQRKLTAEHLKAFVLRTQPGATIRVCGCTTECPQFNNDGLRCGHRGHSLVIVGKDEDGLYTMDDTGAQHTRYYTWQQFANAWKSFPYIKYIKWPNAPTIAPSEIPETANETAYNATFKIKYAATGGISIYSSPSIGNVTGTLKYPATFEVTKKTNTAVAGYTWLYGTSDSGLSGWIAQDDNVVLKEKYIEISAVKLDQSKLRMEEGSSTRLTATVEPADATEKTLTWTSNNSSVAIVENGSITALKAGTAVITVYALDGSVKASCAVAVNRQKSSKAISRTGSNGTVKLAIGEQLQLNPTFATAKGWTIKSVKSSKSKVATVDKNGLVTAKGAGKTTITITTKNKKKAKLTIQVADPYSPTKVVLNKKGTVKLKAGSTLQLSVSLKPSSAVTTLAWASSNKKVAAVDENGKVYALKKGTATIAVKTANGKMAKVKIKVIK